MGKKKAEKDQEPIDIDLDDPEVELAATKIQAGFKGHKARKEMNKMKEEATKYNPGEVEDGKEDTVDIDLNDPDVEQAATKIQAGFKGMKTRKELNKNKESKMLNDDAIDIDLNDPEVEAAATKIQAGFKGMKARKETSELKRQTPVAKKDIENEVDIDLDDPEVELAATKIQAGFKGMKARKEVSTLKADKVMVGEDKSDIDIDLDDPEVEIAATKI